MAQVPGRLRYEHQHVTTDEERFDAGRAARALLPRRAQGLYRSHSGRDPLGILDTQHETRLQDLVPLRIERMASDPFAFYRGTAAIQAADLAQEPNTGASVVISGDAHIANFGIYNSPERNLVFDLNDFDEAGYGPWEWDVKRLITSVIIAARSKGFDDDAAVRHARSAAMAYREGLRVALKRDGVDRFFLPSNGSRARNQFGEETIVVLNQAIKAARKRTSVKVVDKITAIGDDGGRHIIESPPTLTHLPPEAEALVGDAYERYVSSVTGSLEMLLSQYTITDVARRVVGVGSVGTRCFILVMTGPLGLPLVLQLKEATASVIHQFGGLPYASPLGRDPERMREEPGLRVVASQRVLQAASDPFLGWFSIEGMHYYVRQFRDSNVSFDIPSLSDSVFSDYIKSCARVLSIAHARSPNGSFIAGYLGDGEVFANAMIDWSLAYADQSLADYEAFTAAIADGRYTPAGKDPDPASAAG